MSYHIWTVEELESNLTFLAGDCWRFVESQYVSSTMKIVDTAEEQSILESLLEDSKPPIPSECNGIQDPLLYTPFRYMPAPGGSRFRQEKQKEGAFYASETIETALAEISFYRLLFFAESPETPLPSNPCEYTAFQVSFKSDRSIDLTESPLSANANEWQNPNDYGACQALADEARRGNILAIRSYSVRCPQKGKNITLLSCAAFSHKKAKSYQQWKLTIKKDRIVAQSELPTRTVSFTVSDFNNDPRIVRPA